MNARQQRLLENQQKHTNETDFVALVYHYPIIEQNKRYVNRYICLIESIQQKQSERDPKDKQFVKHHILPVSWGGSKHNRNLVRVSFREHLVLHHLLYKTGDRSMVASFYSMFNFNKNKQEFNYVLTINQQAELYEQMAAVKGEISKRNMSNPETREKISNSLKGKYVGEKSGRARAVINIDTGEIFITAREATKKYPGRKGGKSIGLLTAALNAGYDYNGYHWEYYDEYVANGCVPTYKEKQVSSRFSGHRHTDETKALISARLKARNQPAKNRKKIKNLTTGEVFDSVTEAGNKCNFRTSELLSRLYKARKKNKVVARIIQCEWCYVEDLDKI